MMKKNDKKRTEILSRPLKPTLFMVGMHDMQPQGSAKNKLNTEETWHFRVKDG